MKQLLQSLNNGEISLEEIPVPSIGENEILIKTNKTLISPGTEKMLLKFGKSNIFEKVAQQPDKVKQVFDKIKTDGLASTLQAVNSKLNQPITLGYSNVGTVLEVGKNIKKFSKGDRVVSNGSHSEYVAIPESLCCKIPEEVSDDEAVFTVIGSVALQSVRLLKPTLGETFLVSGLGLVGILVLQLLIANGCRVIASDFNKKRLEAAKDFGAKIIDLSAIDNPIDSIKSLSNEGEVDGVIIAASTDSNDPVHQAAQVTRKRGRVILVGVTGLNLQRDDFYKKEITFQVSSSYGPGRYDENYESKLMDYPLGFVRWTANRNFEAFLDLIKSKKVNISNLISSKYKFTDVINAYREIEKNSDLLGLILEYDQNTDSSNLIKIKESNKRIASSDINIGFIGSGAYAETSLIPAFKNTSSNLHSIVSKNGLSGSLAAKKFGFKESTTNIQNIFSDQTINTVIIATRHDSHAELVVKALKNKKNVFVEKPLCITNNEFDSIKNAYNEVSNLKNAPILMVGFNRRFSPLVEIVKNEIEGINGPVSINYNINAGFIPDESWIQDRLLGGGRIIGELCHFVDLVKYLANDEFQDFSAFKLDSVNNDTLTTIFKFKNGSIANINYFSNGNRSYPKEIIEIYGGEKIIKLNNYKFIEIFNKRGKKTKRLFSQDKGQKNCAAAFISSIKEGKKSPISIEDIFSVTEACLNIDKS